VIFNAEQCHKTVQNGKSYKAMQITTSINRLIHYIQRQHKQHITNTAYSQIIHNNKVSFCYNYKNMV